MRFLVATSCMVIALGVMILIATHKVHSEEKNSIPVQQHLEMLYPTVLVAVGSGSGSGTVIFSDMHEDEYASLVLTNWHVVRSAITVLEEWDSQKQQKIEKETRRPVKIEIFEYNDYSKSIGTTGRTAAIVAYDKKRDLALLRIDDRERSIDHVAILYPENKDSGPLGSAPIIFGNSGGSGYVMSPRGTYELIGVPSMVSAYGWGSVVSHMGWWRPISEIRIFLRENQYGFVLGDEIEEIIEEDTE